MGKSKKSKAAGGMRYMPYGRTTTRITDLCDMLSSATAGTIKEQPLMDDEGVEEEGGVRRPVDGEESDGEGDEPRMTRGKIEQRHKKEWKALRSQLEDMKMHKRAIGSRTLEKKTAKKDTAKEIKGMMEEMTSRHKRELEEFDAAKKAMQEGTMESEDTHAASAATGAMAGGGAQHGQPGGGKKKNKKKKNSQGGEAAGGGGADDSMQD